MQKWEYLILDVHYKETNVINSARSNSEKVFDDSNGMELHIFLNDLGDDGWELVGNPIPADNKKFETFYFKRPL